MSISQKKLALPLVFFISLLTANSVKAHDPIFGLGPHVLFKGGIEISPKFNVSKKNNAEETELTLDLKYGITGNWAAGIEIPYVQKKDGLKQSSGQSDIKILTKYRFWRDDGPGLQKSASILLKIKTNSGDDAANPKLGSGTTDSILGLTYGSEGRKWYHWASVRQRFNSKNNAGLRRGDKTLIDIVAGIRPNLTSYREPDTVWILELNGEFSNPTTLNGINIVNTGGSEWFISPGLFWTKRNFSVRTAIQIPIANDLNGTQDKSDYRAKFVLEWHL